MKELVLGLIALQGRVTQEPIVVELELRNT